MSESTEVQELFQRQGELLFKQLYHDERDAFLSWSNKHFGCTKEDALEAFQESMVILYQKIKMQELITINASLKTYLFAIGRNLLRRQFDYSKRTKMLEVLPEVIVDEIHQQELLSDRQLKIQLALKQLGNACQEVLQLFYYENYSVESIANQMNFKSEEVVRSKKYKCLKQLRTLINPQNL